MARRFVFASAFAVLVSGCGDSDGPSASEPAETVSVSPLEATLEAGTNATLRASATDAEGNAIASPSVQWSTSNAAVATVANTGVVSGVASGVARITAAAGDRSGSSIVAVVPRTVTQTVGGTGTVSTPGGEVKVGGLPPGASVKIEPVTGTAAGAAAPGTVYKIGVFTVTTPPQPTITVRYYVEGLPPGFDERNLRLSRKIGVFWVTLPTTVDVVVKTLTAVVPAAGVASASLSGVSASASALDQETTVGAALFAMQPDPASVQLTVGERRRVLARLISLANNTPINVANGSASSSTPGVAALAGAATVSGAEVSVEVVGAAAGQTVVTLNGTLNLPSGGSEQFAATISVTVIAQASLAVTIQGLPSGVNAAVVVTGPSFSRALTASQTITSLPAGTYAVAASNVSAGGQTFVPTPPSQSIALANGEAKTATVTYAATLGSLAVTVSGLPQGTNAAVTVTGPSNFSRSLTGSQTLNSLPAGAYTVSASNVTVNGQVFAPTPATQTVNVAAGQSATATVAYGPTLGSLSVVIQSPCRVNGVDRGDVTITGPGRFATTINTSQTLPTLTPGVYTLTARSVGVPGLAAPSMTCDPIAPSQQVTVAAGATPTATVRYVQVFTLTITSGTGTGSGVVTADGGLSCSIKGGATSGTCSQRYAAGTQLVVTMAATSGSFVSDVSNCSPLGGDRFKRTCPVTMSQSRSIGVFFGSVGSLVSISSTGAGDR